MREELLTFYERELTYLRRMGAEFARKYPKIAGRLLLEPDRCEDPHLERLLEGCAFLAARIHLKLEDEFPQITTALLETLYPHYLRPIPSMAVAEFQLNPDQGKLSTGFEIPRGSMLYSPPIDGEPCKFRACYDTVLWPLQLAEAHWRTPDRLEPPVKAGDAAGIIRLLLRCFPDVNFDQLTIPKLRFYVNGESNLAHTLYELLCNHSLHIMVRAAGARAPRPILLGPECLRPLGFDESEAMLPYPRRSFSGYRLLQEYFVFPEKFFFFDLDGLERVRGAGMGEAIEILFFISRFDRPEWQQLLELGVGASTFRLGCTPIVNLFAHTAEPILVDQTRHEYPVVPDARRTTAIEVFSVDEVLCTTPGSQDSVRFAPFYGLHAGNGDNQRCYWYAQRRRAADDDQRSEVYLSLVDSAGQLRNPEGDTVTVRCTCSNATLPARLPFGSEEGALELEGTSAVQRVVCLRRPTPPLPPPTGKDALWHLISHLSLNYLSLVDEGREALQHILQLYNFSDSPHLRNQIAGIARVRSSRHFARVSADNGVIAARGTRVEVQLDEDQFVGGGVYLFASVLERFLALYAGINSFAQLVLTTSQRKGVVREWPPRAGQSIVI